MTQKEKGDEAGKEACARVMGYYCASLAHSYTLELSYHSIIDEETRQEIRPFEIDDIEKVGEKFLTAILCQFKLLKNYMRYNGKVIDESKRWLKEKID
mgnify:CR=1 FL=1